MSETTIIEVNGVKMEVDLRHAKVVHENLRVGSKVKILSKAGYSGVQVYAGVIVGFEPFPTLPTIIVAYVDTSYSGGLKFAHINTKTVEQWEMVPSIDDEIPVEKSDVLARFDRDIDKKRDEVAELERQRDFFLSHFNMYFAKFEKTE